MKVAPALGHPGQAAESPHARETCPLVTPQRLGDRAGHSLDQAALGPDRRSRGLTLRVARPPVWPPNVVGAAGRGGRAAALLCFRIGNSCRPLSGRRDVSSREAEQSAANDTTPPRLRPPSHARLRRHRAEGVRDRRRRARPRGPAASTVIMVCAATFRAKLAAETMITAAQSMITPTPDPAGPSPALDGVPRRAAAPGRRRLRRCGLSRGSGFRWGRASRGARRRGRARPRAMGSCGVAGRRGRRAGQRRRR